MKRGFLFYILFWALVRYLIQTVLLVLLLRSAPWIETVIQPQWVQATKLSLLVTVPLLIILALFHKTRVIASFAIPVSSLVGQLVLSLWALIIVTSLAQPVWIVLGVWIWNGLGLGLWAWLLWQWQLNSCEDFFVKTHTIRTTFENLGLVAVTIGATAFSNRWEMAGPLLLGFAGCLILSAVGVKLRLQALYDFTDAAPTTTTEGSGD